MEGVGCIHFVAKSRNLPCDQEGQCEQVEGYLMWSVPNKEVEPVPMYTRSR